MLVMHSWEHQEAGLWGKLFSDEKRQFIANMEKAADASAYRNSLKQLSEWLEHCYGSKTVAPTRPRA